MLKELLICTHNAGKTREITALLEDLPIRLWTAREIPDLPEPVEDAETFLGNAQIKARSAWKHTGLPSLADDSGLIVPALGGLPGVHSAYYAGVTGPDKDKANRKKLLSAIRDLSFEQRKASFVCTLVLRLGEQEAIFEGRCDGVLITEERGENGFGYDPVFLWPETGQTLAEIPITAKGAISHRARALQAFRRWLQDPAKKNLLSPTTQSI